MEVKWMKNFFKRNKEKCFSCNNPLVDDEQNIIKLNIEGNLVDMRICDKCADILEKVGKIPNG